MLAVAFKLMAARGVTAILILAQVMLWSRLLEPEEYAVYALVMAASVVLRALLFDWLGQVVVRFLPERTQEPEAWVAAAATLFFALASVLVLLTLAALPWIANTVRPSLALATTACGVLGGWLVFSQQLSRARLAYRGLALKMMMFEFLKLCLGVALILAGWREFGLLGATATAMLCTTLLWMRADDVHLMRPGAELKTALAPLLRYGWPIAVTGLLGQTLMVADRYMLLWLADEATAGRYVLAAELARQPVMMVMLAASTATMPLASRAFNDGGVAAARDVLRSHGTILLLLGLPVVAIEVTFAGSLSRVALGEAFAGTAASIMPLMAVAAFVNGWRSFHLDVGTHLIRRSRSLIGLLLTIVSANLILNAILIPHAGANGAASASLLAQCAGVAYFFAFVPRPPVLAVAWVDVAKIVLAIAIVLLAMAVVVHGRGDLWIVPAAVLGGGIYLLVLAALRTSELRLATLVGRGS